MPWSLERMANGEKHGLDLEFRSRTLSGNLSRSRGIYHHGLRMEQMQMMDGVSKTHQFPISQSHITVYELKMITGALASIIKKSLGPKGRSSLVVSNTGQAAMVKDGLSTLLSLQLSHPMAKTLVESVKNLSEAFGDGCKTMLIYVDALFWVLDKEIDKKTTGGNSNAFVLKNQMAKALKAFLAIEIPPLLIDLENFIKIRMQEALKVKDVSWLLLHVVSTFLNGWLPVHGVNTIANVIVDYLTKDCTCLHNYKQSVQWFSSSVFVNSNKLYSSSHMECGLFLQRSLFHKDKDLASLNAICMPCTFDAIPSDKPEKDICIPREAQKFLQHRLKSTERFLTALRDRNVSLIICSSKLPPFALQLCQDFGIAVIDCVDECDIELICYATAKSPVISCLEDVTDNCLVKVSSCVQFVEGQSKYCRLSFEGELAWQPRSMFLCAPSNALGKQLKEAVTKCMVVVSNLMGDQCHNPSSPRLKVCDNGTAMHRPRFTAERFSNEPLVTSDYGQLLENVVCGGGYFEMVLGQFLSKMKNEKVSYTKSWCCDVLEEMLKAVPQTLFYNLSTNGQSYKEWLENSKLMGEKLQSSGDVHGLNSLGQLCDVVESGVVDVLSVKIATFCSALSIATSLLNLDTVISVRTPQP